MRLIYVDKTRSGQDRRAGLLIWWVSEDAFPMRQAHKFAIGLCLAVFISSVDPLAFAAVKSGQSCKKLGSTSTTNGVKYTCIKSGKKFVWNKGVKVAPAVKPTPTPSPTLEVMPTSSPTPTPAAPIVTVQGTALGDIKKSLTSTPGPEFFKYHYSPLANKAFIEFLEKDLRRSIDYWRKYLRPTPLFNVFYGTQEDLDWIIEAWKPYGHNPGFANDLRGRIAREGNQLNAGAVPSENGSSHLSILRHSSLNINFGDYSFITHESIHIVQQNLSGSNTSKFPCWLREGSANLYGAFLAEEFHGADYQRMKRDQMYSYMWGTSGVDVKGFTPAEWLKHLKDLEGNFSGGCDYVYRFAYGPGLLLSELLVAEYGTTSMVNFWSTFNNKTLREGFTASYKTDLDKWYVENAIPYLIAEYSRIKR